jgi:propionyl-CoA carboxylase alpha chain
MFKKILIANRGEIACRVIKTARRMGIQTVAVYSDADARAPFVRMADEAVHIGPAPAAESYLIADKIIAAAKQTGAEAVHPGYGFLSERASFVEALAKENIAFIGPPVNAIAAMGDKIESKKLAKEAGVNVVPGFVGEIRDTDHAVEISNDIGYPVMMKASAGGDDRVFIEKFIENPRHIEIQILGDKHGNVIYLNERECSIQRRHQKVVEEAPSPFVTPKMRKAMGEQCVALSKAVNYHSAGTVELIVSGADPTGESFYFLEMNTRLQVEHPVTEAITGVDLVEQMIRVAADEELQIKQDDVKIDGWAIENRVYAEDPYRGFLPSTGRLVRYQPPVEPWADDGEENGRRGVDAIRVDDGVFEGGEVSMFYDPMIAKLITWGETRDEAADLQIAALDAFRIEGLGHNIDFLSAIMQHDRFRSGELTTGFIAEEYPDGFEGAPASDGLTKVLAAVGGVIATADADRARRINQQLADENYAPGDWTIRIGEREEGATSHEVRLEENALTVDGEQITIEMRYTPGDAMVDVALFENGADEDAEPLDRYTFQLEPTRMGYDITTRGATHHLRILQTRIAPLASHMIEKTPPDLSKMLICPMPGLLVKLHVEEGEEVQPGQPLATVEAMKMENILRAEKQATVGKVNAAEGDSLAVDAVILELE